MLGSERTHRRLLLVFALLFVLVFWGALGFAVSRADAASLTVATWSASAEATENAEHECSATTACDVMLTMEYGTSTANFELRVGGQSPAKASVLSGAPKASLSFLIAAGQKWELHTSAVNGSKLYEGHAAVTATGVEGPPGPEGKEGPAGKEGPPGPEGKEGKAGSGGVSEEVKLASFGTSAQATLGEGVETIELMGWCIIGVLLAMALGLMGWRLLSGASS